MEAIPIIAFWFLVVWASLRPKHVILYLFFATIPFGSFAVIPTFATGGLTLTPTPIVALVMIFKEIGTTSGLRNAVGDALDSNRLLYIFVFWVAASVTTVFMPRFFAGRVEIVPVRSDIIVDTAMLAPTSQNLSQFVYITISVLAVFAFSRMLRETRMRQHALNALCVGALVTIATGILDYASQSFGLSNLLEVFRTASYALLTNDEVLGAKRIVGLMPEASSFGSISLSFLVTLYFLRRASSERFLKNRVIPTLILALTLLVWMSTSSAAYLGLGLFGLVATFEWAWRAAFLRENKYLQNGLTFELMAGLLLTTAVIFVLLVAPKAFSPVQESLDVMVFQKSTTSSFEERSMWTNVSWAALVATNGLGVGLGGTRASNFAVALVSNVGVAGTVFFVMFLFKYLVLGRTRKSDMEGQATLAAARWSFLPPCLVGLTIGTTPDFGVFNAFLFGLAVSVIAKNTERKRRSNYLRITRPSLSKQDPSVSRDLSSGK